MRCNRSISRLARAWRAACASTAVKILECSCEEDRLGRGGRVPGAAAAASMGSTAAADGAAAQASAGSGAPSIMNSSFSSACQANSESKGLLPLPKLCPGFRTHAYTLDYRIDSHEWTL